MSGGPSTAAARVRVQVQPDEPQLVHAALELLQSSASTGTPGDCGSWQTPTKLSGKSVDDPRDQVVARPRPRLAHRLVADVVRHGRGARREDRHVGAALAEEPS